jgi:hypothetical protein
MAPNDAARAPASLAIGRRTALSALPKKKREGKKELALMRWATSCAASMAAYGEDSSRSALTFMPPVTRHRVSCEGDGGAGCGACVEQGRGSNRVQRSRRRCCVRSRASTLQPPLRRLGSRGKGTEHASRGAAERGHPAARGRERREEGPCGARGGERAAASAAEGSSSRRFDAGVVPGATLPSRETVARRNRRAHARGGSTPRPKMLGTPPANTQHRRTSKKQSAAPWAAPPSSSLTLPDRSVTCTNVSLKEA